MRISSAILPAFALAACGQQSSDNAAFAKAVADANTQAEDNGRIVCAPAGNAAFARQCTVERTQSADGLILTVRTPDGGFHRLLVKQGYGVVSADGAEPAKVTVIANNQIEVAIGGDRYRLPATIKSKAATTAK